MRRPVYDPKSPRKTVSLTLNGDLYARSKDLGINVSQVAEEALATAYEVQRLRQVRAEIEQDLAAIDAYLHEHGSFADFAREHDEARDADPA